jgi:phosphate transport system ATP-binding protein
VTTPTGEPKLATKALSACFGELRALRSISLSVARHEVVAIVGPTGSGKSTLLRCINRMHEMAPGARVEGRAELDGVDVYDPAVDPLVLRRRVGMIFDRPRPLPGLSIGDNVLAGFKLAGERPDRPEQIVESALRRVGLWDELKDRLRRSATGLSAGDQQRLCIARCLALEPEVLLLDEPCSGLDPIATARIEEVLNELRVQVTIVLVTHSLQQAARVADTTAFFHGGELIEHDRTDALFRNPRDPRTENYLTGRFG